MKELHSPKENATTVSKEQQPSAASGYIGNYYLLDLENFADQNEKKEQQGEEPQAVVPRPHRPAYENVTLNMSSADPLDASVERHHPEAQLDTPSSRQESSSPISIPSTAAAAQEAEQRH